MTIKLPPTPLGVPPGHSFWNDWYEKLRKLIENLQATLLHNSLPDLQGGTTGQYYHLTSAQHTDLTDAGDSTSHYHATDRAWANQTGTPTTLSGYGITDGENTSNKNAANGYAGLNASSRTTKGTDTTDDLIVDLDTKGLVLKDNAGTPHYWRVTVNTSGVLVVSDLGTSKP